MHSRFIGSLSGLAQTPAGATHLQTLLYTPVAQQASKGYMYTFQCEREFPLSHRSILVSVSCFRNMFVC